MEIKQELRQYIAELVGSEKDVNYQAIGMAYNDYLTGIFSIYYTLILDIAEELKNKGKINKKKYSEIEKLIIMNVVDLGTSIDINRVKIGLERIKYRYDESFQKGEFLQEAGNIFKTVFKNRKSIVKGIGILFSLGMGIFSLYQGLKVMKKEREYQREVIMTDTYARDIYSREVYPMLRDILSSIIMRRIKDKMQLKHAFFKVIDKISDNRPRLRPYLQAWGTNV